MTTAIAPTEDPKVLAEIYFMQGALPPEIAERLSCSVSIVKKWRKDGNWVHKKQKLDLELVESSIEEYKKFISGKRLEVAQGHLEIAHIIEDKLKRQAKRVGYAANQQNLKKLAEIAKALKPVTDISARAVGLSDRPFTDTGLNGNNTTIQIGFGGMAPSSTTISSSDTPTSTKPLPRSKILNPDEVEVSDPKEEAFDEERPFD